MIILTCNYLWLEMDNYATIKILFCDEIIHFEYNLELFNKKGFGNDNIL
jgi:hypothetical protein